MTSKKSKRKTKDSSKTKATQKPFSLQTLISSIQSPQGVKLVNLKGLYMLLVQSVNELQSFDKDGLLRLSSQDVYSLSQVLFEELERRIKRVFMTLDYVSCRQEMRENIFRAEIGDKVEELTFLLRCCMVILLALEFDQHLLIEKGLVLLRILSRLVSVELTDENRKGSTTYKRSASRDHFYLYGDFTTTITEEVVASISLSEPCDLWCMFICSMLEVFADELLVHKSLRDYFMLIDSASLRDEMLFTSHTGDDNIGSVLEVICAHFILSISNEQAFENFINRLFWRHDESLRAPEMSLPAALSLLFCPILLSAPKMLQAYVILLVAEAIGIRKPSEGTKLDTSQIEFYLSAFEKSVILYQRHMSCLNGESHHFGVAGSFNNSYFLERGCQLPFESYLRPAMRDKMNFLISRLDKAWGSFISNISFKCKPDLVAASVMYAKECLCSFEESDKDWVLSTVNCIIVNASSGNGGDGVLYSKAETSLQNIYLLASILKLMTSSMVKLSWHIQLLKSTRSEDVSSCWEYQALISFLSCFEKFSICLQIQKFLRELLQSLSVKHTDFEWMLLHFSGLLALCYHSGVDFLINACLFTVITTLNMLAVEKDNLHAVESLLDLTSESLSDEYSNTVDTVGELRQSRYVVSSKTLKIQEMYLRTRSLICIQEEKHEYQHGQYSVESAVSVTKDIKEKWDGKTFLKSLAGKNMQDLRDLDELADFIECQPGKDYSCWLKNRARFRMWRHKKTLVLRRIKKKKLWEDMRRS